MAVSLFPKRKTAPTFDIMGRDFLLTEVEGALGRFFAENYRGAYSYRIENGTEKTAGVSLNPEALGNLFRLLFRDNYWTGPVGITLSAEMSKWQMKIDLPRGEKLPLASLSDYVRAGRKTGLSCRAIKCDDSVTLVLSGVVITPPSSVYNRSTDALFDTISKIFRQE